MREASISKIERSDLVAPAIDPGATAIILQRHEDYDRAHGSVLPYSAAEAFNTNTILFETLADHEQDNATMMLFVASDSRRGQGYRSLETAQVAQDAAAQVLQARGINPSDRIINLSDAFIMHSASATKQAIRSMANLREPRIFETPAYVEYLKEKYGTRDNGLSQAAWAAHEADQEKDVREALDAESVYDIVDRTKLSIAYLVRYASWFHAKNPGKRLLIWAATHYDTISPLVKDATGTAFTERVPVDYGAGVILTIPTDSREVTLQAQNQAVVLGLGKASLDR